MKKDIEQGSVCDDTSGHLAWQVKLFMLVVLLPMEVSFSLGSLLLTPCRVFLLIAFVPCFIKVFSKKIGRTLPADWLLLGYSCWVIFSLSLNDGFEIGLESGGILVLESFGPYLFARCYINNRADFAKLVNLLFLIVLVLSFFTIQEALTGHNLLRPGGHHIGQRLGLYRAFGPFEHAILYGVFCASTVSLIFFSKKNDPDKKSGQRLKAGWATVATFMSVSSGALAAVVVQVLLIIWDKITGSMHSKWRVFSFLLLLAYIVIDLLSNRTPIRVALTYLTFSAHTAYNRLTIWEYGTKYNVAEHPWFGIGIVDVWVKPTWMHSASMDNFWLVIMVRHGLPAFVFLAGAVLYLLWAVGTSTRSNDSLGALRKGWVFSLVAFIIAATTVHLWNIIFVWFFFVIGIGAALVKQGLPIDSVEGGELACR